jgi:hypothetical protein
LGRSGEKFRRRLRRKNPDFKKTPGWKRPGVSISPRGLSKKIVDGGFDAAVVGNLSRRRAWEMRERRFSNFANVRATHQIFVPSFDAPI